MGRICRGYQLAAGITSKENLIRELKQAVKQIRKNVVLQACSSWTARLKRVLKADGSNLEKNSDPEMMIFNRDVSQIGRGPFILGHPILLLDRKSVV